jgi:phosphoribosylpyrophosphate synthetase
MGQRHRRAWGLDYGVARKRRLGDNDVRVTLPECAFEGRNVILVADIASTGRTLAEAARQISAKGAASVSVIATHGLFIGDAWKASALLAFPISAARTAFRMRVTGCSSTRFCRTL